MMRRIINIPIEKHWRGEYRVDGKNRSLHIYGLDAGNIVQNFSEEKNIWYGESLLKKIQLEEDHVKPSVIKIENNELIIDLGYEKQS